MERKNIRLRRDEVLRTKKLKKEYNNIILKSFLQNHMITSIIRFFCLYRFYKNNVYANSYKSRQKNYCILTARGRGNISMFGISRHKLNKYAQTGFITGYNRNNFK